MTNVEKIKRAEMLIREVLIDEQENFNGNDSALASIELDVLYHIVNHWYTVRESSIFQNEEGIEIDEYLCVEEIILD
jgi:hypothetical protein